jgi:hypothetical protein
VRRLEPRKHLVFLDIDGVLTSPRVYYSKERNADDKWESLDPVAVDFFNKIHHRYRVEFVIMSTWKDHLSSTDTNILHWVKSTFRSSGFDGKFASPWKTNPDNKMYFSHHRGNEVRDYLDQYAGDIDDFILFDDNQYNFKDALGVKRLIRTDHENGLTYKNMKDAFAMMGKWHERG